MFVTCPRCLATNRLPQERITDGPRCGECRSELLSSAPVAVTGEGLRRFVEHTDLPVLADFWAGWCGPCRAMAPGFAEAAARRPDVRFVKVDIDAEPAAAASHRIRSVPTLVLHHGAREIARVSGAMGARDLLAWLESQLEYGRAGRSPHEQAAVRRRA